MKKITKIFMLLVSMFILCSCAFTKPEKKPTMYDKAVEEGYMGTVEEWLQSQRDQGKDVYIGDNGNWCIDNYDTFIKREMNPFEIPSKGYDGSQVNLRVYVQNFNEEEIYNAASNFNTIYPNIHLQIGAPDYEEAVTQCFSDVRYGTEPNMVIGSPDRIAYLTRRDSLIDLNKLMKSNASDSKGGILGLTDSQSNDLVSGFLDSGKDLSGKTYSLPLTAFGERMFYNKTVFDELGLSVPDHWFSKNSSDTTSMEYVCEALKKAYPASTPLAISSEEDLIEMITKQLGNDVVKNDNEVFAFNNDENKELFLKISKWYKKDWFTTQHMYGSYVSGLFTKTDRTGSFMYIKSTKTTSFDLPNPIKNKDTSTYPFLVDVASIPQESNTNHAVSFNSKNVAIFNSTNPMEVVASWLFAKYLLTNSTFQASYAIENGSIPVIRSAARESEFNHYLSKAENLSVDSSFEAFVGKSYKVQIEQYDSYYSLPSFITCEEFYDRLRDMLITSCQYMKEGHSDMGTKEEIGVLFYNAIQELKKYYEECK